MLVTLQQAHVASILRHTFTLGEGSSKLVVL